MPTRTNLIVPDCSISFTDGQIICASDLLAIMDFGKAALQKGDTVVNEGYSMINTYDPNTGVGNPLQVTGIIQAAAVGFDSGVTQNQSGPATKIAFNRWQFANPGFTHFELVSRVLIGQRNSAYYTGKVYIQLKNASNTPVTLYDSLTDGTPYNVETVVNKVGEHRLPFSSPTNSDIFTLEAFYELSNVPRPLTAVQPYDFPLDGVQLLSLRLFSEC